MMYLGRMITTYIGGIIKLKLYYYHVHDCSIVSYKIEETDLFDDEAYKILLSTHPIDRTVACAIQYYHKIDEYLENMRKNIMSLNMEDIRYDRREIANYKKYVKRLLKGK